ncbi:thiamine-phosphate kinase [Panacagrimonas perspica]|uniref:Thiamine-monophosphate kinase n=1 Tax=Panacagrimonas perspica TaxID=381431 RepID=A0A4S3KA69_9GAMM|nr:thiamine-phosphate kinase [Panacagrimonas perspica]TDU32277.1 thiamine-phosphate kinase [Panacagrimonas perspica]THD05220.1 thiamine-phosphate kinase [Panacagrimonas perspica]
MDEFQLIQRYFAALTSSAEGVRIGIGDDAALLTLDAGQELVVTTDTLVAGRHFPLDTAPYDIGWKSLAVNLSDLAAMGAEPRWFTLALTLGKADESWLAEFVRGLRDLADRHRVALVGGDTTRGPSSITVTAMGQVPFAKALRRDLGRAGDLVCVTGTLGDAALALKLGANAGESLRGRLDRPEPRVAAGLRLRGLASAAIDLSDGLAGDLSHILRASGVGADIDASQLPASPEFLQRVGDVDTSRLALQVQGGDDYELCVCLPPGHLAGARAGLDVPLTVIGCLSPVPGLRFVDASGATIAVPPHGYRHFE